MYNITSTFIFGKTNSKKQLVRNIGQLFYLYINRFKYRYKEIRIKDTIFWSKSRSVFYPINPMEAIDFIDYELVTENCCKMCEIQETLENTRKYYEIRFKLEIKIGH